MKILVVSQYFYPENFRINQLCLDLKERGHQVSVLTGKPNYPKGEYYDGYSFKGDEDEYWNDILIHRVPLRSRKKGALNLVRNYLSFVWHANKKVKQIKEDFDVIYVFEVSPITVALPAIKLKKLRNIPVVMNVQDLWPENIVAVTGIHNPLIIGMVDRLVHYIYKNCDLLLCASPSFVTNIQNKVDVKGKVKYWPQYSLVSKSDEIMELYDSKYCNITFTGNIGEAQGIDLAIEAMNQLRNSNIHLHLVGDGRNKANLEELVKRLKLEQHVHFHGFVEERYIPMYLNSSDAALLILKPDPVFDMTVPAKLQTYLACGVPVLGCVNGISKQIIAEAGCGLVSDEVSIDALAKVFSQFSKLDDEEVGTFKNNAIAYGNKYFDKEVLLNQLEKSLEELV